MTPNEIRPVLRGLISDAEAIARRAREIYHTEGPRAKDGFAELQKLDALLENGLQAVDDRLGTTRDAKSSPAGWERAEPSSAPVRPFRRFNDVLGVSASTSDFVRIGSRQHEERFLRGVSALADLLPEYKTRFAELPDSGDAMMMVIRTLRALHGGLKVWQLKDAQQFATGHRYSRH